MRSRAVPLDARSLLLVLSLLVLPALLVGCSRGPDGAEVGRVLAARLDGALGPGALRVVDLRRLGAGPLASDPEGRERRIVYYSAVLEAGRDLDLAAWGGLNLAALANLLGATEKGISGLGRDGNRAGDRLVVRGGLSFRAEGDGWAPVEAVFPAVGTPSQGPAAGALSQRLIERLAGLFERRTRQPDRQKEIITEELDRAFSAISLRLDRLDRALVVAGGPKDGEYLKVAALLARHLGASGHAANAAETAGSAENLRLLRSGRADLALVQGNVAQDAQLGIGVFAREGPYYELRALASLFPEPIHVLVAARSPIRELAGLAKGRLELGAQGSGSREDAALLLEAAGIPVAGLAEVQEAGPVSGLKRLAAGEIDAVIVTAGAPTRAIQAAAAAGQVRLLPIPDAIREALARRVPGLIPIVLPPATYPGQREPVPTLAATALLVAADSLPAPEVERALKALYEGIDFAAAGSAAGSLIRRQKAREALTIPPHPAAVAYLDAGSPQ